MTHISFHSLKVWLTDYLVCTHTYRPAHADMVVSVSIHPEQNDMMVSCSEDGRVILWDLRIPKPALGNYHYFCDSFIALLIYLIELKEFLKNNLQIDRHVFLLPITGVTTWLLVLFLVIFFISMLHHRDLLPRSSWELIPEPFERFAPRQPTATSLWWPRVQTTTLLLFLLSIQLIPKFCKCKGNVLIYLCVLFKSHVLSTDTLKRVTMTLYVIWPGHLEGIIFIPVAGIGKLFAITSMRHRIDYNQLIIWQGKLVVPFTRTMQLCKCTNKTN